MKKLLALFLAAIMCFAAIPITAFAAEKGGDTFDTAKVINLGKEVTGEGENLKSNWFKLKTKEGILAVSFITNFSTVEVVLFDEYGVVVPNIGGAINAGKEFYASDEQAFQVQYNELSKKSNAKVRFKVSEGTYYLSFRSMFGTYTVDKYSFTTEMDTNPDDAYITYLGLNMKKGSSLQLSAIMSAKGGKVKWSSSKKSVCTVSSKGKITAKKAGTAIITAKCGDSVVKLRIKVTA